MSDRDNSTAVLLSFILGGLVGAGIALLYAPQPGEQTRRKLRYLAEEFGEKTTEGLKDLRDKAEKGVHDIQDRMGEVGDGFKHQKERIAAAVEAGRQAYQEEQKNLG